MSIYLVMSPSGTPFSLVGPYGPGLRISEKFLNKDPHLLIICEGNAVVRYLDLAYYMIMKEQMQDKEWLPYNIRVTMFVKMYSQSHCVGLRILQKALNIKEGNFKLCFNFYIQETQLERQYSAPFSLGKVTQFLGNKNDVDRVYIEGTPMFEDEMVAIYERLHFTRQT